MANFHSLRTAALFMALWGMSAVGFAHEDRSPQPRAPGHAASPATIPAIAAASAALREQRPERVLELLEQPTLQQASPLPEACDLLAQAYLDLGRWEDAESALAHGRKSSPGSPLLKTSQANLYFALGKVKLEDGQTAQARESFKKALDSGAPRPAAGKLSIKDRIARAYSEGSSALERAGDTDRAIGLLKDSLEIDPDNPPAIRQLGNVLRNARRTKDAISFYELYLMYSPGDREMTEELAELYREVGDDTKAMAMRAAAKAGAPKAAEAEEEPEQEFETELAAAPDDRARADVHTAWGRAAAADKSYAEAAEHFRKAMELAPGNREVSLALADVLRLSRKSSEARRLYEDLLELDARDHPVRFQLAKLLVASGTPKQAMPHLEQLAREPSLDRELLLDSYNWLGIAHAQTGSFGPAAEAWNELLKLDPGHANAHYNVGQILEKQSKFTEAISSFEKAVELGEKDPDFFRYLERLGLAYRQVGQIRAAGDVWARLISAAPAGSPAAKRARQFQAQQGGTESIAVDPATGRPKPPQPGHWRRSAPEARARISSGAAAGPTPSVSPAAPLPAPAPAPSGAQQDELALADEAFRQGRLEEALRAYELALARRPTDAALYFKMGDVLHRKGELARERALFKQLLAQSGLAPAMAQSARYRLRGLGEP